MIRRRLSCFGSFSTNILYTFLCSKTFYSKVCGKNTRGKKFCAHKNPINIYKITVLGKFPLIIKNVPPLKKKKKRHIKWKKINGTF